MKAVILAAGQGTRMRAAGPSKPMVSVEGTALLERVITNAIEGGVTDFVVVTGYNAEPIKKFVTNLAKDLPCDLICADNLDWHLGNGRSVVAAKPFVDGPFHVLMADHLFDPEILNIVREEPLPAGGARLAVDLNLHNPHVDIDDVTKVLCKDNLISAIGKTLTGFNAFDTGFFWCTDGLFEAIETSIESTGDDSLSGGIRLLADSSVMSCCDIGGRTWIDVDTPALLNLAQQAMVERTNIAI